MVTGNQFLPCPSQGLLCFVTIAMVFVGLLPAVSVPKIGLRYNLEVFSEFGPCLFLGICPVYSGAFECPSPYCVAPKTDSKRTMKGGNTGFWPFKSPRSVRGKRFATMWAGATTMVTALLSTPL